MSLPEKPILLFGLPPDEKGYAPQCPHTSTEVRRRTIAGGTIVSAVQCLTCGKAIKTVTRQKDYQLLPAFDTNLENWGREQISSYYRRQHEVFDYEQKNKVGKWWEEYNQYLDSSHWKHIRNIVLSRDLFCQVCFNRTSSQAHHLSYASYKKYGISFPIECIGVCDECHDALHGKENREEYPNG